MKAGSKGKKGGTAKASKAEHGTSLLTAFQQIRELIVHGKLAPGTWIVEGDLADRLGMSRTPVRGALHWLQREGYVLEQKSASKTRMFVAPLTKDDARELYAIIGRVEGMAGRQTAKLPESERKEIAKTLRGINQQLDDIVKDGRPSAAGGIFDLDRQFHRTIVASSAGPRLTVLHNAIEPQTERYWRLYASSIINDLHISLEEHEEIIRAIEVGDANRVEKALMANWGNGCERLEHVIEMFGERGSW
ncbi:GntR family transcriptional regulator [Silvibacterium dinghuense]|nr:GntR family transcriptional regulator [Silvibacterium dinghuense]